MPNKIIAQGKTTTEAIENGLKKLNLSKNDVDIKILEEEKRSFYSILSPRVVKVELTVKENNIQKEQLHKNQKKKNENIEEINQAVKQLRSFFDCILGENLDISIKIENFDINIKIDGENLKYLIGYRGEVINAMQNIATAIANKNTTERIKVFLDVANYREKRTNTLEELAEKISKTVLRTGKSITLEPMTAYERKIIHSKLQYNDKIKTFSKGEEPYRKVVIALK